ncbi:MAG: phosphoadenosine phosphosulfate reductase family protein [FCB group bacterium]|nr:phosphoadenosine phosphosulfate reductase family protein [FCB group bacterium]
MKGACRASTVPTDRLVKKATEFLQKYEPVRGYFLADSGGKDSSVARELCKMAEVKYFAGYSNTGIDPPEVVSFIKHNHPETVLLRPKENFYSLVSRKCPPLPGRRWCCEEIKERVGIDLKRFYPVHITGVRAEESGKRARTQKVEITRRMGVVTIKPIFHWREWHIWDFIEKHKLPYCSLYDEGFERIGCVTCPMIFQPNQAKLNIHKERWPGKFRAFERAVKKWYDRKQMVDCPHGSFEKYMEAYYRGFGKKKRESKEKQTQMFREEFGK